MALRRLSLIPKNCIGYQPVYNLVSNKNKEILSVVDFLEKSSVFTNDHRASRFNVNKSEVYLAGSSSKADLLILHGHYAPDSMNNYNTKSGLKIFSHPRKVLHKPYVKLHKDFLEESNLTVSRRFFSACIPFYMSKATNKEIQYCVCLICENSFNLYVVIKSISDHAVPEKLSVFLSEFVCAGDEKGWFQWDCVIRKCEKCDWKMKSLGLRIRSLVPEECYETIPYLRFGKGLNPAYPDRVACSKGKQDILSFLDFSEMTLTTYIKHRNHLKWVAHHHDVFWLGNSDYSYAVMDFSENPKQQFLYEAQSMYYGKVTITLHNTILWTWDSAESSFKKTYIHHLSDSKQHDPTFLHVLMPDVIKELPHGSKFLVLSSDNCASQYKCVAAFNRLLQWVDEYDIEIIRHYGIAGHGKGEIDSCGGHVKEALRASSLHVGDVFYTAEEALSMISRHFEMYPSKVTRKFYNVAKEDLEDLPQSKPGDFQLKKLPGSSLLHFMHFKKNKIIVSQLACSCQNCLHRKYDECAYKTPYFVIESINGNMKPLKRNNEAQFDLDKENSDPVLLAQEEPEINLDTCEEELVMEDHELEIASDDLDVMNSARKDLVAEGTFVAVKTPEKITKSYWVYLVEECENEYFVGTYFEQKGDSLQFSRTRFKEDIFYASVVYPDIDGQLTKGKFFKISSQINMEITKYSLD